jgi:hypothetical protein
MAKGRSKKSGKKKQRLIQPGSRRDMYVLAGLPLPVYARAVAFLENRLPLALVLGSPAPPIDGALYPANAVASLVRTVGQFAVARREKGQAQPVAPATITLFYVPAADEERLLSAFDFAVMPAPLGALVAFDDHYRQLRHDPQAAIDALLAGVDRAGETRTALNHVVRRLGRKSSDESLLLPPRNFLVADSDLVPTFREFRQGARPWTDRLPHLGPVPLTHDDMPKRIPANKTDRLFVDNRGMAFPIAHPTAYDGAPREAVPDADAPAIIEKLRSLYRFGGALERGLHHDAQRSDGSPLGGATFHCSEKGTFDAKGAYANVYPDDFVRVR